MGKNGASAKGAAKEREVETRDLPVKLTDAELLERADRMSAAELEIEGLQLERTQVTTKINDCKKERKQLAHTIDSGTEERPVRCVWHEDFNKNVFRLKREDTAEEIDSRPMTALDRTGKLFGDVAGEDPADSETVPPPRSSKPRKKAAAAATATRHANA